MTSILSYWPQVTYLALLFLGLGMEAAKHGAARTGKHDIRVSIVASGLMFGLLYAGGFF